MADDSNSSTSMGDRMDRGPDGGRGQSRGGRPPGGRDGGGRDGGGREGGGFRIRLSDNEMQAARALQEAFGLRSTVAVLGFSLRTLAQQLEQGQLADLIAQQRAEGGGRSPAPREEGRGGERRRDRGPGDREDGRGGRPPRVDPFARPARPTPPPPEVPVELEAEVPVEQEAEVPVELDAEVQPELELESSGVPTPDDAPAEGVHEPAAAADSEPGPEV